MGTFTRRSIIDELIRNDGYYEDDPRVVRIVEYENSFNGEKCWGVVYEPEVRLGLLHRYDYETEYISNPVVIFSAKI